MRILLFVNLLMLGLQSWGQRQLIDKNATVQTQALYKNLKRWAGSHVLFGHQDATAYGHGWQGDKDRSDVKSVTGSHPAVIGFDFMGFSGQSTKAISDNQQMLLQQVSDTYNRGGITTICWHFNNPVSNDGFYWNDSTSIAAMAAIKPGGTHHRHYKKLLKSIAAFAHQAKGQDGAAIPIIFRPFHEFDGDWFWWGKKYTSREDFIAVWRFTVSYLRDQLKVHNFIYAFSPDCQFNSEQDFLERYPGSDWVDIVGMDNYADFGRDGHYDLPAAVHKLKILSSFAEKNGKIAALTETGLESIPHPQWWNDVLLKVLKTAGVNMAYVLVWRNDKESPAHYYAPFPGQASAADFLKFYQDPFTLFEKDLKQPYQ
ncbi:glycoside hydrolase family 26 protein [Sphingobacterium athyrii]|uniref:Mannan endo-1,4-beta-mannosidase n=1 Tax=Sphingobacterium athyrii TaxID=2152717 RepID=A0A363P001_9SPHI|nr:glycosyl hydrolase [Sphingobacterium athyrii]PUV26273.1 beta-mannosidase [Sphingobacterium athyrii]